MLLLSRVPLLPARKLRSWQTAPTRCISRSLQSRLRYDEMADHMENVGKSPGELSVEERNLLSVAYKNAVGSRRAAWRIISSIEMKEKTKGNEEQAKYAREYCSKVE